MLPWLIKTQLFSVPSFFIALTLAAAFGTLVAMHEAKVAGLDRGIALDISLDLIIFAIIGGRLGHIILEAPVFYFHNPLKIFSLWSGGFVSYGAIITDALIFSFVAWRKKLDFWKWIEIYIVAVPVVALFVRIGCLGAGCCYGAVTHSHLGLVYTHPDAIARPLGVPLYPTQVFAIIYNLLIFFILILIRRKKSFNGQLLLAFFMLYPFFRFFLEFFRADLDRGVYFGGLLSTAQLISIPLFLTSLILYIWKRKKV